ncbi:septum site-determining protein MinC [Pseudogracilibacillus sp. SO30301A]|uniref:septum site-determining protein MinC n=1 Tax=Pseudogracilibacillus sp. SO30301A TaxID=3098291 RepID=UPI00300E5161
MKQKELQLITIKGTKEGLIFYIEDDCSFQDIVEELEGKLVTTSEQDKYEEQSVSVIIKLGHRYLSNEQKKLLEELVEKNNRFYVERYESEVIDKEQAEAWLAQSEIKTISRIIRSGQVLEVEGDLLLIGDVNPGGLVRATGNIFIMGNLHGVAHAGINGDENTVIAASFMNPTQLRISKYISRAPDYESEGVYMECGYLDKENEKIVIDRLQVLPYVRKELRGLERRIHNG